MTPDFTNVSFEFMRRRHPYVYALRAFMAGSLHPAAAAYMLVEDGEFEGTYDEAWKTVLECFLPMRNDHWPLIVHQGGPWFVPLDTIMELMDGYIEKEAEDPKHPGGSAA